MSQELHAEWIAKIRKHASENYNEGGWDYVVESMSDATLIENFNITLETGKPALTYDEAFKGIADLCELLDDRRRDIQGTVW